MTISQFNTAYLEQYQVSYFYINGVINPSNTQKTSSFKI